MRSVLLLFFGSGLFLTLRLAMAEAAFRRNPELAAQSRHWLGAANLAGYESSPDELRAAVNLDPRLSSAWMYLGLIAEADGNLPQAETDLLQAAHVDRQYLPAWTLANFYFRRGDTAKFWPWAARAAVVSSVDYRPLLRLADAMDPSPEAVASRLAGGAPLLRAYLDVLIGDGRLDRAEEIRDLLAAFDDPSDRARLADFARRVAK